MKIRKCPHCVYYIHFDGPPAWTWCWNCGERTDFSKIYSPEERFVRKFDTHASHLQLPSFSRRLVAVGKFVLVTSLPFAVVMLLICNSFEISTVRDASKPFITYDMNEDTFRMP